MALVTVLCLTAFVAGILVHRRYQGETELNRFADAGLALVTIPLSAVYSACRAKPTESVIQETEERIARKARPKKAETPTLVEGELPQS